MIGDRLHLARRLRASSASPDDRGQAPPCLMSMGWLRLAQRLRAGSASPNVYTLLLHDDEHGVRQDTRVNHSTEDHTLHAYRKVPSGYDGTGALTLAGMTEPEQCCRRRLLSYSVVGATISPRTRILT